MKQPFFSIILTTYARPDYLKLAIRSVLNQDFSDYELIVLDDASPDNTEKVVRFFNDKRIVYIKNKINLGFPKNFKSGVEIAKGVYIFLLSDDDLILKSDTLSIVERGMKKRSVGFGQLGLIFYDEDLYRPFMKAPPFIDGVAYFPPTSDILSKTSDWHFGFASGNIYQRSLIKIDDIVNDVWLTHVKPIYRLLKTSGALYFGDHYILGKISKSGNIAYLNIEINKAFHMKKMLKMYQEFDNSKERYRTFLKKNLEEGAINNFPGIKYYTSNKNILMMAEEIINIQPLYKYNFGFWFNLICALITPKFVLHILRKIKIIKGQQKISGLLQKIEFKKHLAKILLK